MYHQYLLPGGLRRTVAEGKGSLPKEAEAEGFPGQTEEYLSDCRDCGVLSDQRFHRAALPV